MQENFDKCVIVAAEAIKRKGFSLDAETQVKNIFNYASTDSKFKEIIFSNNNLVCDELRNRIQLMCELGLDTAKGRKLVYVKTRNVNIGTKQKAVWLTFPEITESYHALIHILVRTKALRSVSCLHTYQNYAIEYSGMQSEVPIVKAWQTPPNERGAYTGVFVVLTLKDGEIETSYYHLSDILATHKKFSKSDRTWQDHQQAMVAKSAIMEAVKYIPIYDDAVASLIEDYDNGQDWEQDSGKEKITGDQAQAVKDALIISGADEVEFMRYLKKNRCDSVEDINNDFFDQVMTLIASIKKGGKNESK